MELLLQVPFLPWPVPAGKEVLHIYVEHMSVYLAPQHFLQGKLNSLDASQPPLK